MGTVDGHGPPPAANSTDPKRNLDAIEEAQQQSRGGPVTIDPQPNTQRRNFSSWKFEISKKIGADKRLKPDSVARVGSAIVTFVNQHTYEAFPGLPAIAEAAAVSVATVKKAIGQLVACGYFTVGRRGRCNVYRFPRNLDLLEVLADLEE